MRYLSWQKSHGLLVSRENARKPHLNPRMYEYRCEQPCEGGPSPCRNLRGRTSFSLDWTGLLYRFNLQLSSI
jgi:hypothetical protein